jgi:hypothetical protein
MVAAVWAYVGARSPLTPRPAQKEKLMDKRTASLFRKTLAATGCLAAAARAAELPLGAARRLKAEVLAEIRAGAAVQGGQGEQDDLGRAVAALESEAVRRALEGVEVPVFHQGRECGNTVKHSDQLLMFLLKTLKPSRYAGGRDAAPDGPTRAVALEIDLSAGADEAADGEADEDADEAAAQEPGAAA